ncbi:hypothetical protein [Salmonirosea aquatica]|uniref:Acyltransferase family protein n=1 Tax=Salmonirosea aquatica TaxID=2654236 RepID=A0A7C9BCK5_9BACT|nr:hypothetical protein [Cytophagaceae bacterium SJW1-29]
MDLTYSSQRKEKFKKASHILASAIILSHAYGNYESGHSSYMYFAIAGVVFLSIALFHHPLKLKFPWIDTCFFLIEALLSFIIAYEYFHMGKKGIPFMYLLAGFFQLSAIYFFTRRLKRM